MENNNNNNRTFSGFTDINQFENQFNINNPYASVQKTGVGQHSLNVIGDAMSYAGSGASLGTAIGGPGIGTAAGAIGGAILGIGKGLYDIFSTDKKEEDLSKSAEKYNAALDEIKYSQLRGRTLSNNIKSNEVLSQINKQNLGDYFGEIQNPY